MGNVILLSETARTTRVALLENDQVVEFYLEHHAGRGIVGNIYKGKVLRVLPGMQAAFVDVGLEKAAFLYVNDIQHPDPHHVLPAEDDVDTVTAPLPDGGELYEGPVAPPTPKPEGPRITDLIREGDELLVQVAKEPLGTKGARITAHITLPGRNLVFMPTVDHIGVSRRIEDDAERQRLRDIVEEIRPPKSGLIVRTVAEGIGKDKLVSELEFLVNLWREVSAAAERARAPALVHADLDLVLRATRDVFAADVEALEVDHAHQYERVLQFLDTFNPQIRERVRLYSGEEPLFEHYGVEAEIDRALERKVWLKSGGTIVIDQAEALTAIDVNTGRFVGKHNLEDTITQLNLEAVREIAYQLRLRNIGGIIILDFIDMEREENRDKVYRALLDALKRDKAKTKVLRMSELGLVEMTRKRVRDSLGHLLAEPCPYCEGSGIVKSKHTVVAEILREVRRHARRGTGPGTITVAAHPDVANLVYDAEQGEIDAIESRYHRKVLVVGRPTFHQEQYQVSVG